MKTLRWILGFPLATAIAYGLVTMGVIAFNRFFSASPFSSGLADMIVISVVFGFGFAIWVFLTCLFIPSSKKIAGIVVSSIALIAVTLGTLTDIKNGSFVLSENVFPVIASLLGVISAYAVSYIIFKDKGWQRIEAKKTQSNLSEVYEEQLSNEKPVN